MTGATKYETVARVIVPDFQCYPVTDIVFTSPECTAHSQAKGVAFVKQTPSLWAALRSRHKGSVRIRKV